ncbi:hypothetical protein AMECASPLE_026784 [Ameca splendens]|uniref:Uncharacterized protein n=1 Tax=Ameca splendens TaxID=208324 RepID=A0ABV0XU73_9TELE
MASQTETEDKYAKWGKTHQFKTRLSHSVFPSCSLFTHKRTCRMQTQKCQWEHKWQQFTCLLHASCSMYCIYL